MRSFQRRATENLFARKTHEPAGARSYRGIAKSLIEAVTIRDWSWKICFPSRRIEGSSQLEKSMIRLYFQQDDSTEFWEAWGKG